MEAVLGNNLEIRKYWILFAMTCCLACIFLDTSAIPIALPSMQKDLDFSGLFMQWILNIFYICTSIFVIFAGKLSDVYGPKKIFTLGVLIYSLPAISSVFCDISIGYLIIRGLQGVGAAFMLPSAIGILIREFPPHQLGRALGVSAGISSVFLCLGPFLAGISAEFFSWKINFLMPLPLCLISLILTLLLVPNVKKTSAKIDLKGLFLLILGLGILMFGMMHAKYWGWLSTRFINYTLLSVMVLMILYYHSRLTEFPLLDFKLFRIPNFTLGVILGFISQFVSSYMVFIAIFFQKALYLSPVESGAHIVVSNLPILFFAPAAGILTDSKGIKFPVGIGFSMLLFSMGMLIFYTFFKNQFILFLALATFGSSNSLVATPVGYLVLKNVPLNQKGVAAGVYNTIRHLGSAFGIISIGTIGHFFRMDALDRLLSSIHIPEILETSKIDEILKRTDVLSEKAIALLKQVNTKSFFISMNAMSLFVCLFICVGLLLTFLCLNDYKKT